MLQSHRLRTLCFSAVRGQLYFVQNSRAFSSKYGDGDGDGAVDLDAARRWFAGFNEDTIPLSISKTTFSNSSGPGGQKTNKTSSKATTVWPIDYVKKHIPKILHPELRSSRYYVSSSDSFTIHCDVHRSQTENKDEARRRFAEEIKQIYNSRVPGVTSAAQQAKVQQLFISHSLMELFFAERWMGEVSRPDYSEQRRFDESRVDGREKNPRGRPDARSGIKKAENAARLKMKKLHSDKKQARKGGGRGADF